MAASPKPMQTLDRIARVAAIRHHDGQIRRMAAALCATWQIPPGQNLVMLLTRDERARSNEDAVACWITEQLKEPTPDIGAAIIGTLSDRFGRKLRSIESEIWSTIHG